MPSIAYDIQYLKKLHDVENMVCDEKLRAFRVFHMGDTQNLYIIGRIRHLAYSILLSKEVSVGPALKLESRYSELLRAAGLGFEVRWGQEIFSFPHPFRPAVVPTKPIVPGPFAEDQAAGDVLWPPTPHLALRLRMSRTLPLLSLCVCMACYRKTVLKVLSWSIPFRSISFSRDTYGTWKSSLTLPSPRMGHRIKYYYYMAWNVDLSGCKSEFSFNVEDLHSLSLCNCELR